MKQNNDLKCPKHQQKTLMWATSKLKLFFFTRWISFNRLFIKDLVINNQEDLISVIIDRFWKSLGTSGTDIDTLYFTVLHCKALNFMLLIWSIVKYSTLHYSTTHYTTVQYTTLHYGTTHYTTVQHTTLQYNTLQYSTLHSDSLYYSGLNYRTLHYREIHTRVN